jgi:hypothetical protein
MLRGKVKRKEKKRKEKRGCTRTGSRQDYVVRNPWGKEEQERRH